MLRGLPLWLLHLRADRHSTALSGRRRCALQFTSPEIVEDSAVSDNRRDGVQTPVDRGEFRFLRISQPRILDVLLVEWGDILVPETGDGHVEDILR